MKERKVWAVSSGSYSDYRIHFLFASEGQATEYAEGHEGAPHTYGGLFVEEFTLYDEGVPECRPLYTVVASINDERKWDITTEFEACCPHDYLYPPPRRPKVTTTRYSDGRVGRIIARCEDEDAALKAVSEHIAEVSQDG